MKPLYPNLFEEVNAHTVFLLVAPGMGRGGGDRVKPVDRHLCDLLFMQIKCQPAKIPSSGQLQDVAFQANSTNETK
jgi:hypothetical protein